MASPGTVVSAEVKVDVSVQSVTVDVTVLATPQSQEVSLPVYALNDFDLYTPSDPRTPLEVAEGERVHHSFHPNQSAEADAREPRERWIGGKEV